MKTNISLRSIAAMLLIAVPSMSIVSCTDDEDLASFEAPEPMVTVPAEEWDILGPTEFEKVGPDASTASQIAKVNEKYDINLGNVSCSTNGRRKVISAIALEALGTKIAKSALTQVENYGKAYAKKKITSFAKELLGIQETQDSTMIKLNLICSQLGEINTKLNEMTEILKSVDDKSDNIYGTELYNAYDRYKTRLELLARHNERYISQIENNSDEGEITAILSNWAEGLVNGSRAFDEAYCYAEDVCTYGIPINAGGNKGTRINLCTLYDKIAYDSFPWENLGYESREQFRALQSIRILQGLELGYLYSCAMSDLNVPNKNYYEGQKDVMQKAIENVAKYFEANEIVYNKTKAICQIKGSHFEMDLKDGIQHHPALIWKDGKPCSMKDTEIPFLYGERSSSLSDQELKDIKSHCLTLEDVDCMRTYFNNFLGKETAPRDWFTLAGVDMTKFSDWSHIVTSDSYALVCYHQGLVTNPFTYNFDNADVAIHFQNIVSVDIKPNPGYVSYLGAKEHDFEFTIKVRYGDVEKKNGYKSDRAEEAWHTIKIKNSTGLTFDSNLLTLTLNRLK